MERYYAKNLRMASGEVYTQYRTPGKGRFSQVRRSYIYVENADHYLDPECHVKLHNFNQQTLVVDWYSTITANCIELDAVPARRVLVIKFTVAGVLLEFLKG